MKYPRTPPKPKEWKELINDKSSENLFKYITDKEINDFIKEINDKYVHWDKFVFYPAPKKANKELIWILVKYNRDATAKKITICEEKGFSFKFNILDSTLQKLHQLDMDLGGSIGSTQIIPAEERNRYLISSIMEEAIASSQLEGASTTRKIAKEMLKASRKPRNKSEKMILNNYLTAKMIKDSKVKKLTPDFILKIHKNITHDTLDVSNSEGKFRESDDVMVVNNLTGEIAYHPPNYQLINKLIDKVCDFINNDQPYFIHPIIKASILHFLIGYIHPFVDGNGRTARALFYWYLSKENYWIIEFMSISKIIIKSPSKYARAYLYTETDENDLTYFINYQLRTIELSLKELKNYINRKLQEKHELFKIIENIEGINDRQAQIIKEFYEDSRKTLSIKEVQEVFNIVYETARRDLLELEKKGLIKRKLMGKQKLVFLRTQHFEKIINKTV